MAGDHNHIEAVRHDGSLKSAQYIHDWVFDDGGKIDIITSDESKTRLLLYRENTTYVVIPGAWVLWIACGLFISISDADFKFLYEQDDGDSWPDPREIN